MTAPKIGEIQDPELMTEIREHARELQAAHGERDAMFKKYDEMYLLDWKEKANRKLRHMQVTASPDFRNQVQGAVRLLVATDPLWAVVENEQAKGLDTDKIESWLNSTWHHSGRLAGEPVHFGLLTSGILYDEMHAAITATSDMLEYAKKAQASSERERLYKKATIERMEEIADKTAFLVESWNPTNGYPEFGQTGMTAYYRVVETTAGEVQAKYGYLPAGLAGARRSRKVNLHTFYDIVYTAVWTDEGDILLKPHGLPRLPVVCQILNGSQIFPDPEDQRQPFGYTLLKSGLWNAQNLSLTAIFTAVLNLASTPNKVYTPANDGSQVVINTDEDIIQLHPNDRLDWIQSKGLIDPSQLTALQLATQKGQESTIYPQALGAPVEGNSTFSELSLLAQSGRLPLIGPQRRGGWGIANIAETMFAMMRAEPRYRKGTGIQASDIPRGLEIDVKLDIKLPQDKLQMANVVNILTAKDNPKVSLAWALENVLNISDPNRMRREVWREQALQAKFGAKIQQLLQADAQREAMKNQPPTTPPGGPAQPMQGRPPQMPPEGMPPEMMQRGPGMAPGQAQAIQGLPPQMGGMMPGAGGMLPPEEGLR